MAPLSIFQPTIMERTAQSGVTAESTKLTLLAQRFKKSLATYNETALVQHKISRQLATLPREFDRTHFDTVFEIGCGTGLLTQQLLRHYTIDLYWANDLVEESQNYLEPIFKEHPYTRHHFLGGNAEKYAFPPGCDLIASASALHWLSDWPRTIERTYDHLNAEGLFCFSIYGPETYKEITALTGNGLNYRTITEHHALLADKFEILAKKEYTDALWFNDPLLILKHIKQTGVGGYFKKNWNKMARNKFIHEYWERFAQNGKIPLTYHPLLFLARKRANV